MLWQDPLTTSDSEGAPCIDRKRTAVVELNKCRQEAGPRALKCLNLFRTTVMYMCTLKVCVFSLKRGCACLFIMGARILQIDWEDNIMACFLVPATEAIVTTVAEKVVKTKEQNELTASEGTENAAAEKIPFSVKLGWLNKLLWGGSGLLAFEHLWHGEVVPWFPFLTAASNPADASVMLHEMSTVGVSMALLVTAVWGGMVAVTASMEKKEQAAIPTKE